MTRAHGSACRHSVACCAHHRRIAERLRRTQARAACRCRSPTASDLEPSVRTALARARGEFDRVAAHQAQQRRAGQRLRRAGDDLSRAEFRARRPKRRTPTHVRLLRATSAGRTCWASLQRLEQSARGDRRAFEAALAIDGSDAADAVLAWARSICSTATSTRRRRCSRSWSPTAPRAPPHDGVGQGRACQARVQGSRRLPRGSARAFARATRLRQPLAMAYQGLGDRAKAEENLRQYTVDGAEPEVRRSAGRRAWAPRSRRRGYCLRRGQRFGKAGRFDLAEPAFRAAVAGGPEQCRGVANLGAFHSPTSAASTRRNATSRNHSQWTISNALAHLSLGVVLDRQGQDQPAIEHYEAALSRDPANVQAMVYLADAKMRVGLPDEALRLYRQALERSPKSARLQLSIAMASVKAGHYREARKVLEASLETQPGNPEIINTLARVLATAPASSVRDGARALDVGEGALRDHNKSRRWRDVCHGVCRNGPLRSSRGVAKASHRRRRAQRVVAELPFLRRNLALLRAAQAHARGLAGRRPSIPAAQPGDATGQETLVE